MDTLKKTIKISKTEYEIMARKVLSHVKEIEETGEECLETFYYLDEFSTTFEDGHEFRLLFFADVEQSLLVIDCILSDSEWEDVAEGYSCAMECSEVTPDGLGTFVLKYNERFYEVEVLIQS